MPVEVHAMSDRLSGLWEQALKVWLSGGWAMVAIAVIALVMFAMGVHIHLKLRQTGFLSVPERTWRRWIDHPAERSGAIGKLLDFVTGATSLSQTSLFFQQLRATESAPFERDLRVMKVCVSAAPLVGLLGTVTGMLATFGALSTGSGGDKTMGLVAEGISEALITTETGLVIALPGLFIQYQLARKYERYKAFLAHLETVCAQVFYRREQRRLAIDRSARNVIARAFSRRLRERRAAS
jgi:biopolymer transport protein ExbB